MAESGAPPTPPTPTRQPPAIPALSVHYARTGGSKKSNELGMRVMQERAYEKRGEQYLLIKSPPASGKSRALMFIALDKLHNQGIRKAIIAVPEKTIGASFHDEPLSRFGFYWDWAVAPQWNLCNAPGDDGDDDGAGAGGGDGAGGAGGKTKAVQGFLAGDDGVLVCTHATFRRAVAHFGVAAFDDCLLAIDEFHHVSANPDNRLGAQLGDLMARDKAHIIAMTGSYFRGDAVAVLAPEDEARFETITYTYYEQLNGYEYLKRLDMGYYFYAGSWIDSILKVLDPAQKTIIYIPNVNARESTGDKLREVEHIIEELGEWRGADPDTGFYRVRTVDGLDLRIADLVEDDETKREKVRRALRDPAHKNNRDHVDIIIALGMAKEGFDWIWCEHVLTIGYRASLTEIVQIIGRATRDAKGKTRACFTNLIAEPDASGEDVAEAVNDTLKAIAASLLMEQVLAPRFDFRPKLTGAAVSAGPGAGPGAGPTTGFDYGEGGYDPNGANVGFNEDRAVFEIEIKGLVTPKSPEAQRICREDLNEVITSFVQDRPTLERGLLDSDTVDGETLPEELTQIRLGRIVKAKYPELDAEDQEAVRQHAIATLTLTQKGRETLNKDAGAGGDAGGGGDGDAGAGRNTALLDGVRRFVMDVRELDIDLIDGINPFGQAYAILAKTMSESSLKQIAEVIAAKRVKLTPDEAREFTRRAVRFKRERGRAPSLTSPDPWERTMAEGVAALARMQAEAANG